MSKVIGSLEILGISLALFMMVGEPAIKAYREHNENQQKRDPKDIVIKLKTLLTKPASEVSYGGYLPLSSKESVAVKSVGGCVKIFTQYAMQYDSSEVENNITGKCVSVDGDIVELYASAGKGDACKFKILGRNESGNEIDLGTLSCSEIYNFLTKGEESKAARLQNPVDMMPPPASTQVPEARL